MIWKLEIAGIPFIVALGSLLHFAFAWSGHWTPAAVFAAVNESVWEHLKMAFWPGLLWAAIEFAILRPGFWRFWAAKGFALIAAPLLIVVMFYAYTALLGRNLFVLDIAIFIVAIVVSQSISARLLTANQWSGMASFFGSVLLAGQIVAFSTLTFYPLPYSLFESSRDGTRGIPDHSVKQLSAASELRFDGSSLHVRPGSS